MADDIRFGITMSEAIREAAASATISNTILETFAIWHPGFTDGAIYIVNDYNPLTAMLEPPGSGGPPQQVTFQPCPVEVVMPEESDTATSPSITVSIDGVSDILVKQLDSTLHRPEKVSVSVRTYSTKDLSKPSKLPALNLILTDVKVTATTVTATATYDDPSNMAFPRRDYTVKEYTGLGAR